MFVCKTAVFKTSAGKQFGNSCFTEYIFYIVNNASSGVRADGQRIFLCKKHTSFGWEKIKEEKGLTGTGKILFYPPPAEAGYSPTET